MVTNPLCHVYNRYSFSKYQRQLLALLIDNYFLIKSLIITMENDQQHVYYVQDRLAEYNSHKDMSVTQIRVNFQIDKYWFYLSTDTSYLNNAVFIHCEKSGKYATSDLSYADIQQYLQLMCRELRIRPDTKNCHLLEN